MIAKLSYLYHRGIYEEELRKYVPAQSVLLSALQVFRDLQARQKEQIFAELTETQLEQSFNEQVFCRVFGYESQFMRGFGQFHVLPKVYSKADSKRQYNDLSLGYRSGKNNTEFLSKVTVELKGPDVDLEGEAVPQAFKYAMASSTIDWVLACNFGAILIFDKTDRTRALHFDLTQITDISTVRRILFPISMGAFFSLDGTIGRLAKIRRRVNNL